jgi:succinate dehydrogenase / fumarate reductase membrane anchor subunit
MKTLRTPLGRVRGLGAAGGAEEWWITRLTSLALVPLGIWFVISILSLIGHGHADVVAWLHRPFPAIAMILFLGVTFHHTYTGLKNVVDDYIHAEGAKFAVIIALAFATSALAVAGIFAVLKIAFGG